MKELKLLYLYPDMLELYGDYGNIQVLKYRLEKRGINLIIDKYSIGDNAPDFASYDIVFAGGGADNEQSILSKDLIKYKDSIKDAVEKGVFFLLICGAYQLFGKYYKGVEGNIIPGLEVFNYYTVAEPDRKKRCIGNIVLSVDLNKFKNKSQTNNGVNKSFENNNEENSNLEKSIKAETNKFETEVIGFENHGGQTFDIESPFGKVLYGNGNKFGDTEEGYFKQNVIATYLHGPLLAKNPKISDYIISYCLERKYNEKIEIEKLGDSFEEKCREQLLEKFLKEKM